MTRAAFIHSSELELRQYPPDCPFKTERAAALYRTLKSMGLLPPPDCRIFAPEAADRATLEKFHTPHYLDVLEAASRGQFDIEGLHAGLATPETPVFLGMFDYASLAVGASLKAAELILADEVDVAFNPSGGFHHAHPALASGFCYLNDVVLACMALTDAGKRVVFLDLDAHHCDGVQDAFYGRSDVLVISFHETGETLFPGTGWENEIGEDDGRGFTVNVPLPAGTDDRTFDHVFDAVAPPLIEAYGPDVIVLELGMDCLSGDPMTHLRLTNNSYADAVGRVKDFGRPVLAVGGGGYHVDNTVRGWALAWSVLTGQADNAQDLGLGLGGVMLESTDWQGGLRDRMLPDDREQRAANMQAVDATINKVKSNLFPLLGIAS